MERNVALQNIAKRLKEENEALRKENASLREELRRLRPDRSPETERKRWREDSSTPYASREMSSRKRIKTDGLASLSPDSVPSSAIPLLPSPCSIVSSPESDSAASSVPNDPYSPMSFSARSPNPPVYSQHSQPAMASLFSGFPGKVPGCVNENRAANSFEFDMLDCGFCSDDTPCVCRELALQHVAARIAVHGDVPGSSPSIPNNTTSTAQAGSHSPPEVKMESRGSISISSTPQIPPATIPVPLASNDTPSILDNLPAYSPPVPLPRRRSSNQGTHAPIFPVFPAQSLAQRSLRPARSTSPNCTGDPSNCLACVDDPFGKAFCAALGGSVKECGNCLNNGGSATEPGFACAGGGNPNISSSNPDCSPSSGPPRSASISSTSSPGHLSTSETMPCNTAWAQLKSHPNIAFADLTLLAEVVARRSKCNGPRVILSPDPEVEALGPPTSDDRPVVRGSDDMPILLTDPHAQYHHGQANHPSSSGSQVLCGRQRVVEVETKGVQDALALLDGQYQRN